MAQEPVVVNVYDMVSMPLFLKYFSCVIKSNKTVKKVMLK